MQQIKDQDEIRRLTRINPPFYKIRPEEVIKIIADSGILLSGHIELLSGLHSNNYLKFRDLSEEGLEKIAEELVAGRNNCEIDVILGRSSAGGRLAKRVAEKLGIGYALVKHNGDGRPIPEFQEGSIKEGQKVLVVDDLITTGTGICKLEDFMTRFGCEVVGIWLFAVRNLEVLRGLIKIVPNIRYLAGLKVTEVHKDVCPQCHPPIIFEADHL